MNEFTCDICLDLMPLVQDDAASQASRIAVERHVSSCSACKAQWDALRPAPPPMNEGKVLASIKKQLFFVALAMIALGALLGVGLNESAGMFYNVLIMPALGAVGYLALKNKAWQVPLGMFCFVYLFQLVKYLRIGSASDMGLGSILSLPLFGAAIYSGLCALGCLIATLLALAFKKEVPHEKNR